MRRGVFDQHVVEKAQKQKERKSATEEQREQGDLETRNEPLALKIAEDDAVDEGKFLHCFNLKLLI